MNAFFYRKSRNKVYGFLGKDKHVIKLLRFSGKDKRVQSYLKRGSIRFRRNEKTRGMKACFTEARARHRDDVASYIAI